MDKPRLSVVSLVAHTAGWDFGLLLFEPLGLLSSNMPPGTRLWNARGRRGEGCGRTHVGQRHDPEKTGDASGPSQ